MASRKSSVPVTTSGTLVQLASNADRADTLVQNYVFVSGGVTSNASLSGLTGKTIRGLVVGQVEHWADGTVWDINNNRPLAPGVDFDSTLIMRGF